MALPPHIGGETGAVYLIFGRWDSPFVRGTRPLCPTIELCAGTPERAGFHARRYAQDTARASCAVHRP